MTTRARAREDGDFEDENEDESVRVHALDAEPPTNAQLSSSSTSSTSSTTRNIMQQQSAAPAPSRSRFRCTPLRRVIAIRVAIRLAAIGLIVGLSVSGLIRWSAWRDAYLSWVQSFEPYPFVPALIFTACAIPFAAFTPGSYAPTVAAGATFPLYVAIPIAVVFMNAAVALNLIVVRQCARRAVDECLKRRRMRRLKRQQEQHEELQEQHQQRPPERVASSTTALNASATATSSTSSLLAASATAATVATSSPTTTADAIETPSLVDRLAAHRPLRAVILLRLPYLGTGILNYTLSLSRISSRDVLLGSAIGLLPGTILFSVLGQQARGLFDAIVGRGDTSAGAIALVVIVLVLVVGSSIGLGLVARRQLRSLAARERVVADDLNGEADDAADVPSASADYVSSLSPQPARSPRTELVSIHSTV